MQILLDTCIIYDWLMAEIADVQAISLIEKHGAYVSPVSVWELAIKHNLGKLELPSKNPARDIEDQGFSWLNVTPYQAERVMGLPPHHKDPFDRLIIAQALHESMTVLTYDAIFANYLTKVLILKKNHKAD
jgi:PIN domain nuclease of toxin-antitoxin system